MKKIVLSLILPFLINAADISQAELVSFTAQKYKADYNTQTQENKDKLKQEYSNSLKLLNAISNNVKDDADYKVAKTLLAINVWSQKYAKNIKIDDSTLKELYAKEKPKTVPTYNLYNILVNDKKKAEEIVANLEKIADKTARLNEFKKQVTLNSQDFISSKKDGSVGWIELQKLDKNVQEQLKNKKVNDVFLTQVENIGYQIILIDDFKPIREVSFDEAKEFLTNLARQQEVLKKIESLIR